MHHAEKTSGLPRGAVLLQERQILLNLWEIRIGNESRLTKVANTLARLAQRQVTLALFTTEHLSSPGYFEPFCDCLPCFCYSRFLGHWEAEFTSPFGYRNFILIGFFTLIQYSETPSSNQLTC